MLVYIFNLGFDSLGLRFVNNYPISASYGLIKLVALSGERVILPLGGFYYIIMDFRIEKRIFQIFQILES